MYITLSWLRLKTRFIKDAVWLALKSLAPSNVSVGLAVTKNFPLRHGLNVKQVLKVSMYVKVIVIM